MEQLLLHKAAREAETCLVPGCGLAPGLSNLLVADAAAAIPELEQVSVRAGILPLGEPAVLSLGLAESVEELIEDAAAPAAVLRDWNRIEVESLGGLETIGFPDPVGDCEAAFLGGGCSTLPWTCAGRIRSLDFKEVRRPGSFGALQALREAGMLQGDPVQVDGASLSPRRLLAVSMGARLRAGEETGLAVLRVEALGLHDGKPVALRYELMAAQDDLGGPSAKARTCACPAAILAGMLARGEIDRHGAYPPEKIVSPAAVLSRLEQRGIFVRRLQIEVPAKGASLVMGSAPE
jgi:lysine 6-dehydrogenase